MLEVLPFLPLLLRGTMVTVALALLGLGLATALGAIGAVGRLSGGRLSAVVVRAYTTLVRGVPDLVMVMLVYFGGQRMLNDIGALAGWDHVSLPPFWAGVLSIGLIYGAYLTETFRGAYMAIPSTQSEAARALGLGRFVTLRKVILPQMLRHALPGYANVWMVLVKSTAVVSVIGLGDLVGMANDIGKSQREPFLFFGFVLLVYLSITWVSNRVFATIERRIAT